MSRVLSADKIETDSGEEQIEHSLRPKNFDEFPGQEKVKEKHVALRPPRVGQNNSRPHHRPSHER